MKRALKGKWITASFCLGLLLVATISAASYRNAKRLINNAIHLHRGNEMLQILSGVSITLAHTEFRRTDDLLLSSLSELKVYETTIQGLTPQLIRLNRSRPYSDRQQQYLDALDRLIRQREALFQQLIVQRQSGQTNTSAITKLVVQVKQNQSGIRQTITALRINEEDFLKSQTEYFQTGFENRMLLELVGTLSTFMLLFGIYGLASYQKRKRQQAEAQQQALAQVTALSELKLQFLSMVSHEFRTPLSHILGSSQLLAETLKPLVEPAKLKNLYRIQASAKLVTQLLNDVLTLARADAGKLEYNPSQIEIQSFCLNLIEDFQLSNESQQVIKFSRQGDRTHAWMDARLMYSVLSNLLSNAIKYSPPSSTITFTLITASEAIAFQIKDEGIGIDKDDLAALYNPFIRGKNAQKASGTGLGLALVKKCLDLHQGQITVESDVGVGTIFTVTVPQGNDL
ncbi:ATP-binding protein [Stenomitos frigidus]|uniref:histidine kinase n=1 Tax=Stenomitos frigidus ULC18 TaxID=2107698 RepID=A0A2T1EL40_9CYAN|nr:ATP-binding protein [Stenomitos frigidus]PSB33423.1 histidine kinase [Stenomitos frigidus ULC18]